MLATAAQARRGPCSTRRRRSRPGCPKHGVRASTLPTAFFGAVVRPESARARWLFCCACYDPTTGDPGVDPNNGLIYLRARWYGPATGQFVSVDPDHTETDAAYYYASDDPITESDPTGDFDVAAAIAYATRYATNSNPAFRLNQTVSEMVFGGTPDDCTNFASQILLAGGLRETGVGDTTSLSAWWYRSRQAGAGFTEANSLTWSLADDLYQYLLGSGAGHVVGRMQSLGANTVTPRLLPGEFIFYQWHGYGAQQHVNFVTSGPPDPYVAQHTNSYDASWSDYFRVRATRNWGNHWRGTIVEIDGTA